MFTKHATSNTLAPRKGLLLATEKRRGEALKPSRELTSRARREQVARRRRFRRRDRSCVYGRLVSRIGPRRVVLLIGKVGAAAAASNEPRKGEKRRAFAAAAAAAREDSNSWAPTRRPHGAKLVFATTPARGAGLSLEAMFVFVLVLVLKGCPQKVPLLRSFAVASSLAQLKNEMER